VEDYVKRRQFITLLGGGGGGLAAQDSNKVQHVAAGYVPVPA
jgi:hypothetical protein